MTHTNRAKVPLLCCIFSLCKASIDTCIFYVGWTSEQVILNKYDCRSFFERFDVDGGW
jgi:hypothetical protein